MVLAWANWLKDEKKKAITRIKSSPSMNATSASCKAGGQHKYDTDNILGTFQHALNYGSWWSVLLVVILVTLGVIAWVNAYLVERVTRVLRRLGILPQLVQSNEGQPDMVETLLRTACEGDVKMVNKLIAASGGNKAILEAQSSSNELGDTVIHMACRFGHSNVVIALLNAGVSVEVCNRIGETPLAVAAESGHTAVVAVLLSRGANEEACVLDTALKPVHLAAMFNHIEVARLLISRRPKLLNCQETICLNTPLHIAVGLGHADMVRFLLDQPGINPTLKDSDGKTALELAAAAGSDEITDIFTEHGITS